MSSTKGQSFQARAERELSAQGSAVDVVLRIAGGPLWRAVVLPVVTTRLHQQFFNPSLEIGLVSGDRAVNAVIEGQLDIIPGSPPDLGRAKSLIASHQFTSVRDRVIARADHPIQSCGPGTIRDCTIILGSPIAGIPFAERKPSTP